jgi:hypothetical protein
MDWQPIINWVLGLNSSATLAIFGIVLWFAPKLRRLFESEELRKSIVTGLRWAEEQATKRQNLGQPVSGEVKLEAAVAKARELGPSGLLDKKSDEELKAYIEAQLAVERQNFTKPPPPVLLPSLPPATSLLDPLPPDVVKALKQPALPEVVDPQLP